MSSERVDFARRVELLMRGEEMDMVWLVFISWWRHQMETFSALLVICTGNSPAHIGQWRGSLMFSLICAWINRWVNNGYAGDLRRYRAHYDVIVMSSSYGGLGTASQHSEQLLSGWCWYTEKLGMAMFYIHKHWPAFIEHKTSRGWLVYVCC